MNEIITKGGKTYQFVTGYRDNLALRNSLNQLTERTFGFTFEQWYQDGYWTDKYLPYSLLDGENIIANVSVNFMDFLIDGTKKHYIQLGTVMTDPAYRGLGLSRILIEKIFADYKDQCELFYLFANDTVLDFYPRFGFVKTEQYQYSKQVAKGKDVANIRKLDMSNVNDRKLLIKTIENAAPLTSLFMADNTPITMFHCTYLKRESIYYIQDYDAVAIADYDKDILRLYEIFSTKKVALDNILNVLLQEQIARVVLGFTPQDLTSYQKSKISNEDTLFVKLVNGTIPVMGMFPELSHT